MKQKTFKYKYVICKHCKWIHFQVSREHAQKEVNKFNKYFDTLTEYQQQLYYNGKKSSVRNYESCDFCGTCYHNFRNLTKKDNMPLGITVGPIISRKD